MSCTGILNYFIQDHTGHTLGEVNKTIIANNEAFASTIQGCTFNPTINGYECDGATEVSVLEFESIARDYNKRIVWPINVSSHEVNGSVVQLNAQK